MPLHRARSSWKRTPQRLPRRRLRAAILGAAALLALALILTVAFADSDTVHHATAAPPQPTNATTPTNTTPTTPATTTNATSTASTITNQLPPATPQQAIANARAAISQAQAGGQLDARAANDLNNRLDDIAQALANDSQQAVHKLTDVLNQLNDLADSSKLSSAGLAKISTPLNQLAALLSAQTGSSGPPGQDKGKHGKNGRD